MLVDPLSGEVRYVGKTKRKLKQRLSSHISTVDDAPTHKNNWIKSLLHKGVEPEIKLHSIVSEEEWEEVESNLIDSLPNLTNTTKGGAGFNGKHSEETKAKMGKHRKGKKHSEETKDKMRSWERTKECRNKIREKLKGNKNALGAKRSKETRAKISASMKGKVNRK